MKKFFLLSLTSSVFALTSCTYNETTDEFETTWLFWVLLLAVVAGVIAAIAQGKKDEEAKQERGKKLAKASEEFHVSAEVTGVNNRYKFIVDDEAKNIIYMESSWKKKIIPFSQVMSVEIEEDNTIISSKSLGRTIGGAVVGNIVAGGAGMIVGGLSGNSKQKKKVSKVNVTIKLRDLSQPSIKIDCFDAMRETGSKKEIKPDDSLFGASYKKGVSDAQKIAELVGIIIDQNDRTPQTTQAVSAPTVEQPKEDNQPASIADELKKSQTLSYRG